MLPPSVTGGTWPADVSYGHVRREKGVNFVPGGPILETIRATARQFMGQEIPQNYGKLALGFPLTSEVDFDPALESVHGLLAESFQQREESAQDDQPMQNPYEQPSRRAGSSLQREEPDSQWEQQRSSSGSSEPSEQEEEIPPDEQPEQEATPTNVQVDPTQDDPMGEEVVDLWEAEDPPDEDYVVEQVTRSSISASNPWVQYEAGIICARSEDGQIEPNSSGEKVVVVRERAYLLGPQPVALRRQSIGRADWEKLPWAGHLCYLFTRTWEMGRLRAHDHKTQTVYHYTDWMRGQGEPPGWEDRFDIDRERWSENWLLYERDLMIQKDMEWLAEAVFKFYRKHLDKLIRGMISCGETSARRSLMMMAMKLDWN